MIQSTGIHEALRLSDVHLLIKHSLKNGIVDIHLVYLKTHQHGVCK